MVKQNKEVDLLIIGGGPAGLTAAIYAVRGNLEVVLLESEVVGGQVASSYTIENYPGFIKIIGKDLRYENGQVITDFSARAKTDNSCSFLFL